MGSETLGLVSVALAVALFGSFALPTKSSATGDGVFFQWVMCTAIFFVGIGVHFVQCSIGHNAGITSNAATCPQFEPMASLGGAIWCTSNLLLVPLVDVIGMGMTMMSEWWVSQTEGIAHVQLHVTRRSFATSPAASLVQRGGWRRCLPAGRRAGSGCLASTGSR